MIVSVKEVSDDELSSVLEIQFYREDNCRIFKRTYIVECDGNDVPVVTIEKGGISFREDGIIEDHMVVMDEIGQCFTVWNAIRAFGDHPKAPKPYVLKLPEKVEG